MRDVEDIEKRLEIMDRELHAMLADIRSQKSKVTYAELSKKISSHASSEDTTELIRKMRDRQ